MNSVNKITLLGNLGNDPEVKNVGNDLKVASFSLATTETFKKAEEKEERTQWHNCVAWNGLASIVEKYLKKGAKVYLEGKMEYNSYTDKEGIVRYTSKVIVQEVVMVESKNQ